MKARTTSKTPEQIVAMNEALVLGSLRQHEMTEAAEKLNAQLHEEIAARQEVTRDLSEKVRLLDLTTDAIIVRDLNDRISLWNKGAEKMFGWTCEEVIDKHLHTVLQTEFPKPMDEIIAQLRREGVFTGEVTQVARNGRRVPSFCRWVLDRETASILTSYTDITERRKSDQALREAQTQLADRAVHLEKVVAERTAELTATNKQLEAFVYSIAHDMRAPLRSMQGFSSLLLEEAGPVLNDTCQNYAERIKESACFMDSLLTDLLTFSTIAQRRVELSPVNPETVIQEVLMRHEAEIQEKNARVETDGPWTPVLGHQPTLTQALDNLVANALKFSAPGRVPTVRVRGEEQGGFFRVWVEDNGIGIAPEHQTQIFGLFTRLHGTEFPGTGIGLAIVQKGIERMLGRTGVESTLGEGSRFWFELWKA